MSGASIGRMGGRISPREAGAAPLDVVIGIMAFLAALALGASLLADRAAEGWREGLAGRLTIQVLPPEHGVIAARLAAETEGAVSVLKSTDGIVTVTPLSEKDTQALVEPWIGGGAVIADLPLPKLIDATISPGTKVDLAALAARLKAVAPDSILDDHTRWIGRLKVLADGIVWAAYFILALIAVATTATVAFATRAGLQAHHDIVALLHQMGAHAGFIARAFEWHYFVSALAAATVGALCAAILFSAAGGLELAGIEPVPFLPPLALHFAELAWLAAIPAAAAAIAWATARLSVLAAVSRIY
jgi:cell division transport system permease protein